MQVDVCAGPSPVNSYELWPADVQAMRDLGVKVRRLLCSVALHPPYMHTLGR